MIKADTDLIVGLPILNFIRTKSIILWGGLNLVWTDSHPVSIMHLFYSHCPENTQKLNYYDSSPPCCTMRTLLHSPLPNFSFVMTCIYDLVKVDFSSLSHLKSIHVILNKCIFFAVHVVCVFYACVLHTKCDWAMIMACLWADDWGVEFRFPVRTR